MLNMPGSGQAPRLEERVEARVGLRGNRVAVLNLPLTFDNEDMTRLLRAMIEVIDGRVKPNRLVVP